MGIIYGTSSPDYRVGSTGNDTFYMYQGNDTVVGNGGTDLIYGNSEPDLLNAYSNSLGTVYGGQGNDTVYGANVGGDNVYGEIGNDVLYGYAGSDRLEGGDNGDTIYGNTGNDSIFGNANSDVIYGGDGADVFWGGQSGDVIYGDLGNDYIQGEADDDNLYGGAGNDWLQGNDGDDNLYLGAASGNDTVYYEYTGNDIDIIYNFEGNLTNGDRILNLSGYAIEGSGDLFIGYFDQYLVFHTYAVLDGRADLKNPWNNMMGFRNSLSQATLESDTLNPVSAMSETDEVTGNPIDPSAEFDFEAFTLKAIEALKSGEPLPQDPNVIWMNPEEVTIEQLQESLFFNQMHQANQAGLKETLAIQQEEYQKLVESGEIAKFIVPPGAFPPVSPPEPLPPYLRQVDADTIVNIQAESRLERLKAGISLEDFPLDSPDRQAFLEVLNAAEIDNFILPPGAFPPVPPPEPLPPYLLQVDADTIVNIQSAPLLEQAKAGISVEDFPLGSSDRQAFVEAFLEFSS